MAREEAAELPSDSRALREAEMDRDVLDTIEREIDAEVQLRFPGTAVRQAVLLQYGDDPLTPIFAACSPPLASWVPSRAWVIAHCCVQAFCAVTQLLPA